MEKLFSFTRELSRASSLNTIMSVVNQAVRELARADGAFFVLRRGDDCHYAEKSAALPLRDGRIFSMDACAGGWAMRNRQPVVIPDVNDNERVPAGFYKPCFPQSLAAVPVRDIDPLGAIEVYWAKACKPDPDIVRMLQVLADSAAMAMEKVEFAASLDGRLREHETLFRQAFAHTPVGTVKNITERKLYEEALVRERNLSETMFDSLPGVFFLFDQEGRFVRWGKNSEAITGYSAAEISRLHPLDLFKGSDRELIAEQIQTGAPRGRGALHCEPAHDCGEQNRET